MIKNFKIFEDLYTSDTYVGPAIVNTIASTVVGDGSDGLIGGACNPGDLGGEFPKKYNAPGDKTNKFIPNITKLKYKMSKKRRNALKRLKKIDVLNFEEFKKKRNEEV